eukprot:GGOE01010729.1.p3 GENE.GGOE01010729.1~~GGOE01010729.1.p3  ORF type:complete len:103 (+),score=3.86 GGOE01010729.1:1278-1586(+)
MAKTTRQVSEVGSWCAWSTGKGAGRLPGLLFKTSKRMCIACVFPLLNRWRCTVGALRPCMCALPRHGEHFTALGGKLEGWRAKATGQVSAVEAVVYREDRER